MTNLCHVTRVGGANRSPGLPGTRAPGAHPPCLGRSGESKHTVCAVGTPGAHSECGPTHSCTPHPANVVSGQRMRPHCTALAPGSSGSRERQS